MKRLVVTLIIWTVEFIVYTVVFIGFMYFTEIARTPAKFIYYNF
jgi:hypothetical protein